MSILNPTEKEEREYLDSILHQLEWALQSLENRIRQFSREFREDQTYLRDQQPGMDEADIVSSGQSVTRMAFQGESEITARRKLSRLMDTPYFGRIDFVREGTTNRLPVYIGIYSYDSKVRGLHPIYDWRAPVSSMFYDFELGKAWYKSPVGIVNGTIELRRQYRIRQGKMEYMIENSVNIQDDVLQRELSKASGDKMKQIVATIQRDQNAIIRNETSAIMIIQGVAGSGKTSIAIHRIAFLLYRFRDTINSNDILIISPNKVFADYISNVLPELGEAQIPEMGMEELASTLLDNQFRFQTFLQQVFAMLEKRDEAFIERVRFKSTSEFIHQLNRYLVHLENNWLKMADLRIGDLEVPASFLQERFRALQRVPLLNRFQIMVEEVENYVRTAAERKLRGHEKSAIQKGLSNVMPKFNAPVLELYRGFYDWLGRSDLFKMDGDALEYADVFPLIYCKIRLEGPRPYQPVKHLVIDEMQDYTPIQYTVLERLFKTRMTILGDVSQTVNPISSSNAEAIQKIYPQADIVKLVRSYRSTYEIIRFAQRIRPNPDLEAIERHGPEPEVLAFQHQDEEEATIRQLIDRFRDSDYRMLAIICKTPSQARALSTKLSAPNVYLLDEKSTYFREGVIITTAPMAKGLEFDEVIVPYASDTHYRDEMDRNMLYIACTRAMHRLTVTYSGIPTVFLKGEGEVLMPTT